MLLAGASFIFFAACGGGGKTDQTNPEDVVKALFEAAKSKNFEMTKNLCDPKGENDGDTRSICELKDENIKKQFVEYFSNGGVTGKAQINGDKAVVPFKFGPNGQKREEMKLIKRDGKWYLYSF